MWWCMYYSKNDVKTSLKWNILVLSTNFTQWVGTYLPSIFPLFVSFSRIQTVEEEEEEAAHPPLVCPPCKSTTFDDVLRLLLLLPPDNPCVSNKGKRIKAATSNWLEREIDSTTKGLVTPTHEWFGKKRSYSWWWAVIKERKDDDHFKGHQECKVYCPQNKWWGDLNWVYSTWCDANI